jgi:hypothetical protein
MLQIVVPATARAKCGPDFFCFDRNSKIANVSPPTPSRNDRIRIEGTASSDKANPPTTIDSKPKLTRSFGRFASAVRLSAGRTFGADGAAGLMGLFTGE